MPSSRRLKVFCLLGITLFLLALYITSSARETRSSQFYTTTQDALAEARAAREAKLRDSEVATGEDDMISHRLKQAEEDAKRRADEKGDAFHGEETKQKALKVKESLDKDDKDDEEDSAQTLEWKDLGAGEKSVAGRKTMKHTTETVLEAGNEDITEVKDKEQEEPPKDGSQETPDEKAAHAELNEILKKSPIIIFSKSYCPYSKRAKHILLEKYTILPEPYVVELDLHPIGPQLQAFLGDITGRRTVPNVLIRAKSIGGGDDVQELDETGQLMDTVTRLGGKQVTIRKGAPSSKRKRFL